MLIHIVQFFGLRLVINNISNLILNWGIYNSSQNPLKSFPLSYTAVPSVVAQSHANISSEFDACYFPYNVTLTGFTTCQISSFDFSYIAIGTQLVI